MLWDSWAQVTVNPEAELGVEGKDLSHWRNSI